MAQARRAARIGHREPSPWARLRWPALLLVIALTWGVCAFMFFEGWSFIDSLYMTLLTLTTVGFEEARPLDASGEVITISLMVLGVGVVLIGLSLTAAAISEGELGHRGRRRRMERASHR